MQTFFPSLNIVETANILWEDGISGNRLNNQINEALIILRTLTGWYAERGRKGWPNHACTKMWAGYEDYLADYVIIIAQEYEKLSGNDCSKRINQVLDAILSTTCKTGPKPPWLTEEFASNHRSILLGKAHQNFANKIVDHQLSENDKLDKVQEILEWYQSFSWSEQPAKMQMINSKMRWPYLWELKGNEVAIDG